MFTHPANTPYSGSQTLASYLEDQQILTNIARDDFRERLHRAEAAAWDEHGVAVDHTAIQFGEDAHFGLSVSVPDTDAAKFADALEAMARAMRGAK
jgi:hypothetical protein